MTDEKPRMRRKSALITKRREILGKIEEFTATNPQTEQTKKLLIEAKYCLRFANWMLQLSPTNKDKL